MKVLVSHSYFLSLDPKEAANHKPYPPLAPLHLIALIRQKLGIECTFYDVMFDQDEHGLIAAIEHYKPELVLIYDDDFNYLTKMCLENMREAMFRMIRQVNHTARFVAHGSDASDQAERYLRQGFDYVVHRNPEEILLQMIRALREDGKSSEEDLRKLPSLSYHRDGQAVHNDLNKKQFDLNDMPMPAWDVIKLRPYRRMWLHYHGYFSLNVSTSHGCPYRCNWCAKPLYGRSYKARPAEMVANEFDYLANKLHADHVWITDDIFALKHGWITAFANALEERGVKLPYKIQSRADLMNDDHVAELARSGCAEVWMGVESGSQKILDAMDKDTKLHDIPAANRRLKKQGLQVGFFLQYGYPGEELEDIQQTLQLIRTCLPDHIGVSISYPLKGTPFYESVVASMGEKKNWRDSGDLALMYPGKFKPDFYRALHQYTHHYFGFISLLRSQSLKKRIRRLVGQYRHIPGMIKYRYLMNQYRQQHS